MRELPLKYEPPFWSALPNEEFGFDVIKNGTIVSNVSIHEKPFLVVGRHPQCDLVLQHPSISRSESFFSLLLPNVTRKRAYY